jgi:hypothetical protein
MYVYIIHIVYVSVGKFVYLVSVGFWKCVVSCVCGCVCMYMYVWYAYTCIYIYIYMYIHTHVYIHVCICIDTYVSTAQT